MNNLSIKIISILLILLFCNSRDQALGDSTDFKTKEVISNLLQEPSEESDNSDLYDAVEELISNPVNINEAGLSELESVPFMDIKTANQILNHRKKFGHIFSISELYSVEELSKEIIEKISPFLTVVDKNSSRENSGDSFFSNLSFDLRSKILNDLQKRKGFTENKFNGSKYKIYNRVRTTYKNFELGFLTDKDPGESSINDFSSYYLFVKKTGIINNMVLGDYLVQWGQGLALWSLYGFSKGADAVFPVKKNSKIINKYTSSTESNFFRGAAVNLKFQNFSLTTFYSRNRVDASIDSVSHGILSIPIDGLHRTENELTKRKSTFETVYGSAITFQNNFLNTGILYYNSVFNNSFIPGSIYDIKGDKFNYTSFFYDIFSERMNLFGEFVYDGVSVALINGIKFPVNKDFIFVTSVRSYPRNFNNIHGFSFGEKSGACKNEFGIYNGIRWNSPAGLINFYYDQFKFPYASYQMPMPSSGNEFLIDYKKTFIKNFETKLRFKYENKEITFDENNISKIVNRIKEISRIEIIYKLNRQFRLKGRFEYNNIIINNNFFEEGFLTYQDIQVNLTALFNFYSRIIFFKTDSFNSAVYEYENDLTGTLLNTALYGEGIRWYLVINFRLSGIVSVSCKYSETIKPKEKTLGTGLLEIDGPLDNRLSLQLDINY